MPLHFDRDRMLEVLTSHDKWWSGELERPLVHVTVSDAYEREDTKFPLLDQSNCMDENISPEQVIDALDADLSSRQFMGDAFPMVNFAAFGPGVLAALSGARLDNSSGRVWFFYDGDKEIENIHIKYDPDCAAAKRIKAIYKAGLEKWDGSVILGMPDLGGVMDVVASFRGSEDLLLDLYDAPDQVERLIREAETAWHEAYEDFSRVLASQKCHTDWSRLLSSEPSYILQSDFSYMIGNPMFKRFVLPTLKRDVKKLTNTIYHLDGIGELNHLDDILSIKELAAVQWVPGDGQLPAEHWLDIYQRIAAAGKHSMIVGGFESYLKVLNEVHQTPYASFGFKKKDMAIAEAVIKAR